MSTLYKVIEKNFSVSQGTRTILIFIVVLGLFIIFARYGYLKFYKPFYDKNSPEVSNSPAASNSNKGEAVITFYHVDWCPHCKTAQPEWENFRRQYHNKRINNYTLKCVDLECIDEETCPNIESFPTVKLTKDGKDIELDSKINTDSLSYFAETVLQD